MRLSPTQVEIKLAAIAHNFNQIQKRVSPAKIMAVVKADAYGHGLIQASRALLEEGADYLGVARVEEGVTLREAGITSPILVFGGFFEEQISTYLEHDLEFTLYDLTRAEKLHAASKNKAPAAKVQIKIDTGMGRVGIPWQEAVDFVTALRDFNSLEMTGIYTHLASSDSADKSYANTQLQRFEDVLHRLKKRNIEIPLKHAANSGAILDLPQSYFDMVRPGVILYGYYPSRETSESLPLQPAMEVKSQVIAVNSMPGGTKISYNMTYETRGETQIAVVPVGYGDGYNRLLSNQGQALINGTKYPVVGTVCMDQIMIDVGPDAQVTVGDEVVLLGRQGNEAISMWEICEKLNTIPYEVTCSLTDRMQRGYR